MPTLRPPATEIDAKLSTVPPEPGVYIMKDAENNPIYVGKASNLKRRLSSYFSGPRRSDVKTGVLIRRIADFETIITRTEKEALILESNLIKRHKPRYNVILKDGKRYPSLRMDTASPYPNLNIVRKVKKDGALYFGPFTSSSAVNQTLKTIHKTFKLRKCKTRMPRHRSRPCLNYQMDACLAPCCFSVDRRKYDEIVREVVMFLKGRTPALVQEIKTEMRAAAKVRNYEKAAVLRDRMFALEKTLEAQVAITTDFLDRDILAVSRSAESSLVALLVVRGGYLLGTRHYVFPETIAGDAEMIGAFIRQYYEESPFVPREILVPVALEDSLLLEDMLSEIKGRRVRILRPQRGEKVRLLKLAAQNAQNILKNLTASESIEQSVLATLRKRLKMNRTPLRIECFDCSCIAGTDVVAAMAVFEKARPRKSLYRKYIIKTADENSDYAYMAEALKRRFGKKEASQPYPDILMVDGGRGQLGIAVSVVRELNLEGVFEIVGIAKKDENKGETRDKIYKAGQSNPLNLSRDENILLFLQKIRDEAHRFALTFHRKRRSKAFLTSALDAIPGVGKKRKGALLRHFGSVQKIGAASTEALCTVPGIDRRTAENIKKTFERNTQE